MTVVVDGNDVAEEQKEEERRVEKERKEQEEIEVARLRSEELASLKIAHDLEIERLGREAEAIRIAQEASERVKVPDALLLVVL